MYSFFHFSSSLELKVSFAYNKKSIKSAMHLKMLFSLKVPTMLFRAVACTINCFFSDNLSSNSCIRNIIFHYHVPSLVKNRAREQHSILQGEKGL